MPFKRTSHFIAAFFILASSLSTGLLALALALASSFPAP